MRAIAIKQLLKLKIEHVEPLLRIWMQAVLSDRCRIQLNSHPWRSEVETSFKELAQTFGMHPPSGYYLLAVLNQIIASRWMHMNWYILA